MILHALIQLAMEFQVNKFKLSGVMLPTNGFGQTDTGDYHNSRPKSGL